MRPSRKRRELTTFVGAVLVASGCSLTTSFSDLTGGGSVDSGVDAPEASDAPVAVTEAASDVVVVDSAIADASDAGPSYRALVLSDTPVAYFRLGESAGTTAASEIPGFSGTYVGAPSLGVPGAIAADPNTAVQLGGTVSSRIELGDVFDFPSGAAFTVELWVKANVIDDEYRAIFSKRASDDAGIQGYWLYAHNNLIGESAIQFESVLDSDYDVVATPLTVGVFHHVVVEGEAQSLVLLVDGEQRAQTLNAGPRPNTSVPLMLGADPLGASRHQGVLDEVVIYDRVLPLARVRAHYAAGRAIADGG